MSMESTNSCPCTQCGETKYYQQKVTAKNRETICRPCHILNRTTGRKTYTRICKCGDVAELVVKPVEGQECRSCSSKTIGGQIAKKRYKGYKPVRYWAFCRYCDSIRHLTVKRKTSTCGSCSRKYEQKKTIKQTIYFDLDTMKYIVPKIKVKEVKVTKPIPRPKVEAKPRNVSTIAIQREIEINRAHKEYKPKLITQTLTEEDMIAKFLASNEVTVIESPELDDLYIGEVHIKGY